MVVANLQRDRPVASELLVRDAKNPKRGGKDNRSEDDGPRACRMVGRPRNAGCDIERGQNGHAKQRCGKPDGIGGRAAPADNPHTLGPALEGIANNIPGDDAKHPSDLAN
jgi:hypothetical protein